MDEQALEQIVQQMMDSGVPEDAIVRFIQSQAQPAAAPSAAQPAATQPATPPTQPPAPAASQPGVWERLVAPTWETTKSMLNPSNWAEAASSMQQLFFPENLGQYLQNEQYNRFHLPGQEKPFPDLPDRENPGDVLVQALLDGAKTEYIDQPLDKFKAGDYAGGVGELIDAAGQTFGPSKFSKLARGLGEVRALGSLGRTGERVAGFALENANTAKAYPQQAGRMGRILIDSEAYTPKKAKGASAAAEAELQNRVGQLTTPTGAGRHGSDVFDRVNNSLDLQSWQERLPTATKELSNKWIDWMQSIYDQSGGELSPQQLLDNMRSRRGNVNYAVDEVGRPKVSQIQNEWDKQMIAANRHRLDEIARAEGGFSTSDLLGKEQDMLALQHAMDKANRPSNWAAHTLANAMGAGLTGQPMSLARSLASIGTLGAANSPGVMGRLGGAIESAGRNATSPLILAILSQSAREGAGRPTAVYDLRER